MADKDKKGVDKLDKLGEALRKAEEAVLKKDRQSEDDKKKKQEKKYQEQEKKKQFDLDEIVLGKAPAKKPPPGPRMVSSDKQEEKRPVQKPTTPAKPTAEKPADRPSPNLSFGELDLSGSANAGTPELELSDTEPEEQPATEKAPAPAAPSSQPPPAEPAAARPVKLEPPPRRVTSGEVYTPFRRSYARDIKIVLIVLLILAAIGGGVFGFLRWRESEAAKDAAEKEKLDSSSRDSLMDDSYKKEKFK